MTIPVFYQVIELTPSGKSARIREINTEVVENDGYLSGSLVPIVDDFVEDSKMLTRRILGKGTQHGEYVKEDIVYLSVWNNKPAYFNYLD